MKETKEPPLLDRLKPPDRITDGRKVNSSWRKDVTIREISTDGWRGPLSSTITHQKTENTGRFPDLIHLVSGSCVKLLLACELWLHLVKTGHSLRATWLTGFLTEGFLDWGASLCSGDSHSLTPCYPCSDWGSLGSRPGVSRGLCSTTSLLLSSRIKSEGSTL